MVVRVGCGLVISTCLSFMTHGLKWKALRRSCDVFAHVVMCTSTITTAAVSLKRRRIFPPPTQIASEVIWADVGVYLVRYYRRCSTHC